MKKFVCLILFMISLVSTLPTASAQIKIKLEAARTLFVRYEPILVAVSITNLSGRDLLLKDTPQQPWFGFEITGQNGRLVPPLDNQYFVPPLEIPRGATVRRTMNINPLYSLRDYGTYRARANIYDALTNQFFSSNHIQIEITEGRMLWQQTVGAPDTNEKRTFTLMSHRPRDITRLYVRIEDTENGVVYLTAPIGPFLRFDDPDIKFDVNNEIHILHRIAPRSYQYSQLSLDGEVRTRDIYHVVDKSVPRLKQNDLGAVGVVGGVLDAPVPYDPALQQPKISDRPENL